MRVRVLLECSHPRCGSTAESWATLYKHQSSVDIGVPDVPDGWDVRSPPLNGLRCPTCVLIEARDC